MIANLYSLKFLTNSNIENLNSFYYYFAFKNSLYKKNEVIIVPDLPIPAEQ